MASTQEDLFDAIAAEDVERVRELLADDPSVARARDAEGISALMRARYRTNRALVSALREQAGELDAAEAAALGEIDRLTMLLDGDPSLIEARTPDGFTLLHLAAFFSGADAVRLLIARGADLDARGTGWMRGTALHSAASARDPGAVRALLDAGADPDARQAGGFTPLHAAAQNGDAESVHALLDAGADPSLETDDGKSAATFAEDGGDGSTITALADAMRRSG